MYQLVSASVKRKNSSTGWKPLDITNIQLKDLFVDYSGIYVILSNPFVVGQVAFNVYNLINTHANSQLTFPQFLVNNGNLSLQTEPLENAIFEKKIVKYVDAFKALYNITNAAPNTPPDTNHAEQDKTWLVMSKEGVTNELFYNHCMVNVNGFFHMIDYYQYGIQVIDGMKSNFISGCNNIGVMSFGDVGAIEYIPITPDMLYKQNPAQKYKDSVHIDLGKSAINKTVILVIGGYMHLLDDVVFRMIDDERCVVNFSNYPFKERYYESKKYIDLSSLELETTVNNLEQVGIEEFYSDEVIAKYLTLSQSFFVLVDAVDLTITKKALRKQLIPEQYISDINPIYPMIVGNGKLANYWSSKHHGKWSVTCVDTVRNKLVFNKTRTSAQVGFTPHRVPDKPQQRSNAYFLEIAKEV